MIELYTQCKWCRRTINSLFTTPMQASLERVGGPARFTQNGQRWVVRTAVKMFLLRRHSASALF